MTGPTVVVVADPMFSAHDATACDGCRWAVAVEAAVIGGPLASEARPPLSSIRRRGCASLGGCKQNGGTTSRCDSGGRDGGMRSEDSGGGGREASGAPRRTPSRLRRYPQWSVARLSAPAAVRRTNGSQLGGLPTQRRVTTRSVRQLDPKTMLGSRAARTPKIETNSLLACLLPQNGLTRVGADPQTGSIATAVRSVPSVC